MGFRDEWALSVAGSSVMSLLISEQTVAGLQGLPQPEDRIAEWHRAWDEMTDRHLEGEEVQAEETWQLTGRGRMPGR